MAEKTFDPQSGKFIARIAENLPKSLTSQDMQYWIDNPKKLQKLLKGFEREAKNIVSEKFEATDIVVSTTPTNQTYTIGKDIKKLIATKADGGLFDYVDGDIAGWFPKVTFSDNQSVSGRVQLFKNNITHGNIIAEGERLGIYQEYELGDALLLANQLVTAGAIEKPGYGAIIYLKNRKDDNRYRLFVYRNTDGKLRVNVSNVDLYDEWRAGYGVLFSN